MSAQGEGAASQLHDATGPLRGGAPGVRRWGAPRLGILIEGGRRLRQVWAVHQCKQRRLCALNVARARLCSTMTPLHKRSQILQDIGSLGNCPAIKGLASKTAGSLQHFKQMKLL